MTTMTRGKKLFVLLLALVILTGVTLLVAHLVPDEDESTAEDTSYIIFSLDPDQVTQLSWTYEGSTVTLTKDENSNWSYPDDEAFPLDASYPDAMVQAGFVPDAQLVRAVSGGDRDGARRLLQAIVG